MWGGRYRPIFAGVFGLVHGAGFANYLKALFVERLAVPLFGFNVGIELGQVVVLGAIAVAFAVVDYAIKRTRSPSQTKCQEALQFPDIASRSRPTKCSHPRSPI